MIYSVFNSHLLLISLSIYIYIYIYILTYIYIYINLLLYIYIYIYIYSVALALGDCQFPAYMVIKSRGSHSIAISLYTLCVARWERWSSFWDILWRPFLLILNNYWCDHPPHHQVTLLSRISVTISFSPLVPIIHRSQQVLPTTPCVSTELLYVSF